MLKRENVENILSKTRCDSFYQYSRIKGSSLIMPDQFLCYSRIKKNEPESVSGISMPINSFCYIPKQAIQDPNTFYFQRVLDSGIMIVQKEDWFFIGEIEKELLNAPFNGEKFITDNGYKYSEAELKSLKESDFVKGIFRDANFCEDYQILFKGDEPSSSGDWIKLEQIESVYQGKVEVINIAQDWELFDFWIKPHPDFHIKDNMMWNIYRSLGAMNLQPFDSIYSHYSKIPFKRS